MMNKAMLVISAIIGIACVTIVQHLRLIPENELLRNSSMGIIAVCIMPWLVVIRRKLFKTQFAVSRGWMKAITVLLFIALLTGPIASGTYFLWLKLAKPTDDWGGFSYALGYIAIAAISHTAGFWACIAAFLIQLWRDQWQKVLTVLAIAYQLLMYLLLCKMIR